MLLIMGISPCEKKLNFEQNIICSCCGGYGRFEVYLTYMYFSLFFIPIIKWNRRYYVRTTCCHASCEIDSELGHRIAKGEVTELNQNDLHFTQNRCGAKRCRFCGYITNQDFQYCPHCGRPF